MEANLGREPLRARIRANLNVLHDGSLQVVITDHPRQLSPLRAQQLLIRALDPKERASRLIETDPPGWYPRIRQALARGELTLPDPQAQRPLHEVIPRLRVETDYGVIADVFIEEDDVVVFEILERPSWMPPSRVRRRLAELFHPDNPPSRLVHMPGGWYQKLRKLIAEGQAHLEEE